MKHKKSRRAPVILLMAGVLCAGGTAAYFSDFAAARNTVAVGRNTTEIQEEFPDPTPTPIENNPQYDKTVWVGNVTGGESGFNVDCYIRVSLSYSNDDIGRGVTLQGLDTENWVYDPEDGYYYYRWIVEEGQRTTPLFTGIQIDSGKVDATYQEYLTGFSVNVYEESVQAGSFADYGAAWNYFEADLSDSQGGDGL
ncbi:MAG: SipW-dependent-type signal peptide-containing protein [Clostridiales bacterium]|nr:SipW-dependent-type signal peptide-containing protein [Clostridiales bacterium]